MFGELFSKCVGRSTFIDSVITVKHNGYYASGVLKHPYFWRQRKDVSWENLIETSPIQNTVSKIN
jgi:hypothetical protein